MELRRKIFAVSDIHGHFSQLKTALDKAGFEKNNPNHLLVCCGDFFDRGTENYKVLQFLDCLDNKVMLRGNHEDMLLKILETGRLESFNYMNGTLETVTEFFGKYCMDGFTNKIDFSGKTRVLDRITVFIGEAHNYFETDNYVFVHGWLPTIADDDNYIICENWRSLPDSYWQKARWTKWTDMYEKCNRLTDKTIVCGHAPSFKASKFDPQRNATDHDIFYGNGVIVLDGGTYISGQVNVLVVEE